FNARNPAASVLATEHAPDACRFVDQPGGLSRRELLASLRVDQADGLGAVYLLSSVLGHQPSRDGAIPDRKSLICNEVAKRKCSKRCNLVQFWFRGTGKPLMDTNKR